MSIPGFTLGELLDHTVEAVPPLIDPWLDERGLGMIHAAPGVGKSMLALALGLAVAGGGRLLDWSTPRPRRVLIVDAEMTRVRLQERARVLMPSIDGIDPELARENLKIVSKQEFRDLGPFPLIGDEASGSDVIAGWAREWDAALVILDNVTTLAAIKDENNAAEIRPLNEFTDRLRVGGAAVLLLHHVSKGGDSSGDGYRGSTALDSPLEVRIGLKRANHPADKGVAFRLAFHKQRHLIDCEPLKIWLEGGQWRCDATADPSEGEDLVSAMVDALKTRKHATQRELANAIGVDPSVLSRRLKPQAIREELLEEGEMESVLDGVKTGRAEPSDY